MAKDRGIGGAAGVDKRTALNVKLKRLVTNAVTARGNTVIARHMTEIAVFDGYFRFFDVGSIARETVGHIAEAENLRRVVVAETVDIDFGGVALNKGYAVVEIVEIGKTAVFNGYSAVERRAVLDLSKFVKRPSARALVYDVFEGKMRLFSVGANVSDSYVSAGKAIHQYVFDTLILDRHMTEPIQTVKKGLVICSCGVERRAGNSVLGGKVRVNAYVFSEKNEGLSEGEAINGKMSAVEKYNGGVKMIVGQTVKDYLGGLSGIFYCLIDRLKKVSPRVDVIGYAPIRKGAVFGVLLVISRYSVVSLWKLSHRYILR
jgi:hypothetical protein